MSTHHLGLDLGGTNIKVAVVARVDDDFEIVSRESVDTEAAGGPRA